MSKHEGRAGSSNEHMGYERSTGDGTNEHEASAGSTNERRRVRTSTRVAWGIEQTSTGGTNIAGAAVGAAHPSSPSSSSSPSPIYFNLILIFLYYLKIFTYSNVHIIPYLEYFNDK